MPETQKTTIVSVIDGKAPAIVDEIGGVSPAIMQGLELGSVAPWHYSWAVRSQDKWHLAGDAVGVRQHRPEPGPNIETLLRVADGDISQTVYAAIGDKPLFAGAAETIPELQQVTIIEFENQSSLAVAVAIAVQPNKDAQAGGFEHVSPGYEISNNILRVDENSFLAFSQTPAIVVSDKNSDIAAALLASESTVGNTDVAAEPGLGLPDSIALVFSLPHKCSIKLVSCHSAKPLSPKPAASGAEFVNSVPERETIVSGWRKMLSARSSFEFPDPTVTASFDQCRARLMIGDYPVGKLARFDPAATSALEAITFGGDRLLAQQVVESLMLNLASSDPTGVALGRTTGDHGDGLTNVSNWLDVISRTVALIGNHDLATETLETAAQLLPLFESQNQAGSATVENFSKVSPFEAVANIALVADQPKAAGHLLKKVAAVAVEDEREAGGFEVETSGRTISDDDSDSDSNDQHPVLQLAKFCPTQDSAQSAIEHVGQSRNAIIIDGARRNGQTLTVELLPHMPSAWLGSNFEVANASTRFGKISFAIRWHGYRPALIWEAETLNCFGNWVTLSCPGLDANWSTNEPAGEVLLEGSSSPLETPPQPGEDFS